MCAKLAVLCMDKLSTQQNSVGYDYSELNVKAEMWVFYAGLMAGSRQKKSFDIFNNNRWYPAKRALPAMLTHGSLR